MNKHMTEFNEIVLDLPRQVDQRSGRRHRKGVGLRLPDDRSHRCQCGRHKGAVSCCAPVPRCRKSPTRHSRFLDVMVRQVSGFEIKVFVDHKRKDTGPYQVGVNQGLVERGWMHDYGKGQVAYSGPVLRLAQLVNERAGELVSRSVRRR